MRTVPRKGPPFACKWIDPVSKVKCVKQFNQRGNLLQHVRMHNGEKPYRCNYELCNKTFSTSSNRNDH